MMAHDESSRSRYGSNVTQYTSISEVTSYEGINLSQYPFDPKHNVESTEQQLSPEVVADARRHHVFRFWPWEIGSIFVATGLIVATYSILSHFNGQKVPEWAFSINLNTLIALISTIMRAAMLVGVAEIISQTKWTWFSRPRPLSHLEYFDAASRSVSGSLSLLFVAPGSIFGVLGALITILSLGIGPFTQQAIKTVGCLQIHDDMNASIPLAHFIPGNNTYYRIGAGSFELQVDMKGTMVNGIVNPTGNDTAISPVCATGNCTFPSYQGITHSSIGMCSACIDTTSFISGPDEKHNYTLPNGMWVSPAPDLVYLNVGADNISWAETSFSSELKSVSNWALANITVLSITSATCPDGDCLTSDGAYGSAGLLATSCSLYACVKNYNAEMKKGVLSENLISTRPATPNWVEANAPPSSFISATNYTALQTPCLVGNEWYDLSNISNFPRDPERQFAGINVDGTNYTAPNECLYKVMFPYVEALATFMSTSLLSGTCTYNARQGEALFCREKWWLSSLYNNKQASFDSVSTAFDQFSTAVTNKLRTTGTSNYSPSIKEAAHGIVNEMTVCTVFQWQWLLMPTLLVAATAAVLIAIIIQNLGDHRQPVWKSSLLPLLYYGFGDRHSHHKDPNRPVMDLTELNQAASDMRACFRNSTGGAGFENITPSVDHILRKRGKDVDVDSLIEGI